MPSGQQLGYLGRLYVWGVVIAGVLVVVDSVLSITRNPLPWQWAMLAVLTLLSGSFTVRIPGVSARLSVSDTFVFAAVLLFGPAAATMIVVLDTLVISFWLGRASVPTSKLFFNITAPALAIWAASQLFYFSTGIQPLSIAPKPVLSVALPLFGLATLYFLLNSWLIAFAVSLQRRLSAYTIWKDNFLWLSLNYFSGASVAALLLPYLLQANTYDSFLYVTGFLLPVLIIFYLTFKAALGRVDDANRHLAELNRLYLSTIETLAMAIDAKDQITHGHIRRVQQYAVGLAKAIGVTEPAQISAIEAASLLHDMGKLAVPEYILNKPGKLTSAEFEKMKLHASVGADILSSIDFPYPVVPIVRHHHESWDGTGYPDGLKGTEIPIGARILSVVDCFDALTSDRPYRPRLSDNDAMQILLDRRGHMYDPLVVDTFIAVHANLASSVTHNTASDRSPIPIISRAGLVPEAAVSTSRLEEIAASTEEMLTLYELAKDLTTASRLSDICDVIAKHLRRVVPATICAFFAYDADNDELNATYVTGQNGSQLLGLRIPRGERLTGWVAANKKTIVNSDPVLDLGELARTTKPRLHTCLSTPLLTTDRLIGVLSLYSADPFSEDHRRIIEAVARQVSATVMRAVDSERQHFSSTTHFFGGVQTKTQIQEFTPSGVGSVSGVSILLVSTRPHRPSVLGPDGKSISAMVGAIEQGLRTGDLLFRYGEQSFLILLTQTDAGMAKAVGARVSELLAHCLASHMTNNIADIAVGVATAPVDGTSIDALASTAVNRQRSVLGAPPHSSVH